MTDINVGDLLVLKDDYHDSTIYYDEIPFHHGTRISAGDIVVWLGNGRHLNTLFLSKHGVVGWNMFRDDSIFNFLMRYDVSQGWVSCDSYKRRILRMRKSKPMSRLGH